MQIGGRTRIRSYLVQPVFHEGLWAHLTHRRAECRYLSERLLVNIEKMITSRLYSFQAPVFPSSTCYSHCRTVYSRIRGRVHGKTDDSRAEELTVKHEAQANEVHMRGVDRMPFSNECPSSVK